MTDVKQLITEHLDIWLTAETEKKSGRGRSSGANDTIYGVQKLRELILDLAFQGKLVAHSSTSSEDFLNRINSIRDKLIKDKTIKKNKILPIHKDEIVPHTIPANWSWEKLGNLGVITSSSRVHQKDWQSEGIPFYRAREIVKLAQYSSVENDLFISNDLYNELTKQGTTPEYKDIMLTGVGTIGVPYIVKEKDKFYFKDASVLIFKNIAKFEPYYFERFFKSPLWNKQIHEDSMGTTVHTLTIVRANEILVPIPPLEEQQRIVEKVDELMQLCDQLEQQQTLSSDAHATLVDTLLKALTESSDADEFQDNWQRIVANFDLLFNTEYSIEQLKQTVLQLAVMGKLVKQDPSDEPASELLKKIADEKAKLIKEGKIKKSKPLPEIGEDEKPFELPSGWEYTRLSNIAELKGGFAYKSELFTESGKNQVIRMGNVRPDFLRLNEKAVFINESLALQTADAELFENDIVITMTGTRGKKDYLYTAQVKHEYLKNYKLFLNQRLTCIRVSKEYINAQFISILLKVDQILQPLFDSATGTANQANVGMLALGNTIIPLPPLDEQKHIAEKVNQLFSMIDQLQVLQRKLQKTKLHLADALVANAVEGV